MNSKISNDHYKILLKKSIYKGHSNFISLQQNKINRIAQHKTQINDIQFASVASYAYLTSLGRRTKNEDRITIQTFNIKQRIYQYFAIFDGHGGYLTSNYLSLHLHSAIEARLI